MVDKASLGFLDTAAVPSFPPISKALPGFFITLVAQFLPALAELLPKLLKNLPSPSAAIV